MHRDLYSNKDFTEIKKQLNQEILRRGTFKWWDPLTIPSVGQDKTPPLTLPNTDKQIQITENTYTINHPSEGSIEQTRNIDYPAQGENPSGQDPNGIDYWNKETTPNTSAAQFNVDEFKNFLVGLSKIQDVNLFYGRDEVNFLAYRDPQGIKDALENAQKSELNALLKDSDISPTKNDPNGGMKDRKNPNYPIQNHNVTYPMEDGEYVMPSGEYDGEEIKTNEGLGPDNFYDDYGAKPGDSNYHPYNRYVSEVTRRDWNDQGHNRDQRPTVIQQGGENSIRFGQNPRNPQQGNPYIARPVYGGKEGACNIACSGLCHVTCDNECGESCTSTCWNRCGNACTSNCGSNCSGYCSTLCYTSCKTKCENSTGYSCVKSGAKTVKISSTGGSNGEPAKNHLSYTTHTCDGCSFSCQFYPNKKTECWDSGCMGKCFISCENGCATSCFGGCIDNEKQSGTSFKTGKGRGCSSGCTINCIGLCHGVCEGYCIQTCWQACKQSCSDNCTWDCNTNCGSGCANRCNGWCGGCFSCTGTCEGKAYQRGCIGCGTKGGCTSSCQHGCDKNCVAIGCRSVCGIGSEGACESNCRMNCMGSSCTSKCDDACSSECTTCVNTCGFQCGYCSSKCSANCGAECNTICTQKCSNNCTENCTQSCSEECGACSSLCFSCTGMCIGICSIRCDNGCSSCSKMCSWWCDSSCNRDCFSNCSDRCISNCSGSCATHLMSETTMTKGPDRKPTAEGYIYKNPKNRWEERESFKLFRDPDPYKKPIHESNATIIVQINDERNLEVLGPDNLVYVFKQTSIHGGVYTIDQTTGKISVNKDMINGLIETNQPNIDGGGGIFIVVLFYNDQIPITDDDIEVNLPFGFETIEYIHDENKNTIIVIQRDEFLFPEEKNNNGKN